MKRLFPLALATILVSGCSVFGAAAAEEPSYEVLDADGAMEIRQYDELLVAQTTVEGTYDEVGGTAFRRLAGFIFGDNQKREEVAMTAPVIQERASRKKKGEKIAMTAPVLQQQAGEAWVMTFIMPAEYTLATLPEPRDPAVEISIIPARKVATIRFSGLMGEKKFKRYSAELAEWVADNGHTAISSPRSAGYNPPWTLPPMRRNEIHIDIE